MQDNIKITGTPTFTLKNAAGEVKQQVTLPNMIVTTGKNWVTSRMVGTASAVMTHMALGTSTTAASVVDTALVTEVGRVALTSTTRLDNSITYSASFGPGVATGALTEAGVLNASTAGTLLCRVIFPVFNKEASDTLDISWNVTLS